jgi:hypothetical protein
MNTSCTIELQKILDILSELHWIDVNLFKLGTELGARDATAEEVARSLHDFFVSNDVGNRLANAKNSLRDEVIAGSDMAAEVVSEFLEKKLESARSRK